MNVLISDLKGFAWLFLVPTLIVTVHSKSRFEKILTSIMAGAVLLGCIVFAINCVCSFFDEGFSLLYESVFRLQFGTVSIVSNNIYRIFTNSCPYMVFACAIAIFRQVQQKKVVFRYVAVITLCVCAILLSFTRSAYGCVFVVFGSSIFALLLFYHKKIKSLAKFFAVTFVTLFVTIFVLEFVFAANYFNFALSRTFGVAPAPSVAVSVRNGIENFSWDSVVHFVENLTSPQDGSSDFDSDMESSGSDSSNESTDTDGSESASSDESTDADGSGSNSTNESTDADGSESDSSDKNPKPPLNNSQDNSQELNDQNHYLDITQQSDQLRAVTQAELMDLIQKNPVFGNGLGASAPSRLDGLDEYFYLDVLARMGIVGLILYVLPFVFISAYSLKYYKKLVSNPGVVSVFCGMLGFWAITWFNPWMNAVLGIAMYALCSATPDIINENTHSVCQEVN